MRLDPIHIRILEILERDGRATVSSIAREVGLTDNAVRYRIRRLRSTGIVRRVTVHVDASRLGKGAAAMLLLRLAPGTDVASLAKHPCIAMLVPTRGTYQAVALIVARDSQSIQRLISEGLRLEPAVLDVVELPVSPDAELPVRPSACLSEPL